MTAFCEISISVVSVSLVRGEDPESFKIEISAADEDQPFITLSQGDDRIEVPLDCVKALVFAINHVGDFIGERSFYLAGDDEEKLLDVPQE